MTTLRPLICFSFLAASLFAATADQRATIEGNTSPALPFATHLGHKGGSDVLEVVVGLRMQHEDELHALITRQQNPSSPDYHRWITPAEFNAKFAPAQSDVDRVSAYLQSNGLTIVEVTTNRLLIRASGSVSKVEQAFGVRINEYEFKGELEYSNDRDPSLPADLRDTVQSVMGMSSIERAKSFHAVQPTGTVSYTPPEIATAYNFPNANNAYPAKTTYSGKGVTLAIMTSFGYKTSDVDYFWKYFSITRTGELKNIPISVTLGKNEDPTETTVDVEEAGAQAPGADMLVYIIKSTLFPDFITMYNQVAEDNAASVVSSSWGYGECVLPTTLMQSADNAFAQGTAQGISYFISSGDFGAYECSPIGDDNFAVEYPASDPFVTAVGGTSLNVQSSGKYSSETAWTYSGGGNSSFFARPSWQVGPGVALTANRETADIAFDADPNTGYWYYYDGAWVEYGYGTSFGAPNWAALWALGIEALGGTRTGQAAPLLYELGASSSYHSALHDVTKGNNGGGVGPGYDATKNWDYPTGWGSPNGAQLVNWLVKHP